MIEYLGHRYSDEEFAQQFGGGRQKQQQQPERIVADSLSHACLGMLMRAIAPAINQRIEERVANTPASFDTSALIASLAPVIAERIAVASETLTGQIIELRSELDKRTDAADYKSFELCADLATANARGDRSEAEGAALRAELDKRSTDAQNELRAELGQIATATAEHIANAVAPVQAEIVELRASADTRGDALEAEGAELRNQVAGLLVRAEALEEENTRLREVMTKATIPQWRGVWREGETFERGAVVAHSGASWIARDQTSEKPGDGATAWQLMVKAARHGKDGKSAFELAQGRGYVGTEQQWLASLHAQPTGTATSRKP
jgi:hypothetical protein